MKLKRGSDTLGIETMACWSVSPGRFPDKDAGALSCPSQCASLIATERGVLKGVTHKHSLPFPTATSPPLAHSPRTRTTPPHEQAAQVKGDEVHSAHLGRSACLRLICRRM